MEPIRKYIRDILLKELNTEFGDELLNENILSDIMTNFGQEAYSQIIDIIKQVLNSKVAQMIYGINPQHPLAIKFAYFLVKTGILVHIGNEIRTNPKLFSDNLQKIKQDLLDLLKRFISTAGK